MNDDHDTIPTPDAAKPVAPNELGGVVVDFETYKRWLLGDATAVDVVEKVVGFE